LVRKGKGHIHLYQPNSAGFGTLIKERMGSQPTDRGAKLVMQLAMIADVPPSLTHLLYREVGEEGKDSERHRATCRKNEMLHREERTRPRTYLEVASIAS